MNSELPKKHKSDTKAKWRYRGLILTNQEEFDEIYERYMASTNCELCNKPYKSNRDRHMDHIHYIDNKWGWFRNVICNSCNQLRSDNKIPSTNTSGYIGICKDIDKEYKQGFRWRFRAVINGENKQIKTSINLEYLIKFATQWKLDNNYNT